MSVDTIDAESLLGMDTLADAEPGEEPIVDEASMDDLTLSVRCPRCNEVVSMTLAASIQDTGKRLVGRASVDDRDLELHGMVCSGSQPTSE